MVHSLIPPMSTRSERSIPAAKKRCRRFRAAVLHLIAAGLAAALVVGCGSEESIAALRPSEDRTPVEGEAELVLRLAHISDAQLVDEESPGRLASFGAIVPNAWRPYEAALPHFLDGMIRAVNRFHIAEGAIDALVHTGDAVDNAQQNELQWFLDILAGRAVNPTSGFDDRSPEDKPPIMLDPHATFQPAGLYTTGVHGDADTIPWFGVNGNHDRFAVGVWPVVAAPGDRRVAPLPLRLRLGLFLPRALEPASSWSFAPISPAQPGPPSVYLTARPIPSNEDRRFLTREEFVDAHRRAPGLPEGHGFLQAPPGTSWYVTELATGIRMIGLDTSDPEWLFARLPYAEGAISGKQAEFLESALAQAEADDVWVVVATHHPSDSLDVSYGSAYSPASFRAILRRHPCVKLHICGHLHRGMAFDRGGYLELVAPGLIDPPFEGQVITLHRVGDQAVVRYFRLADTDVPGPPPPGAEDVFDDPFAALRSQAKQQAFPSP